MRFLVQVGLKNNWCSCFMGRSSLLFPGNRGLCVGQIQILNTYSMSLMEVEYVRIHADRNFISVTAKYHLLPHRINGFCARTITNRFVLQCHLFFYENWWHSPFLTGQPGLLISPIPVNWSNFVLWFVIQWNPDSITLHSATLFSSLFDIFVNERCAQTRARDDWVFTVLMKI